MSTAPSPSGLRVDRRIPRPGNALDDPAASWTLDDRRLGRLGWWFVGFGIFLRLTRWLLRYPLWHDEAFLAVNFINRGFADLLRPLDYLQVSPIGFLFLERLAVLAFGFSEWSLRLVPTLAAIVGLIVFRDLACRLLNARAALFAVGILAVAQSPLRHGNEVKPYALDLMAAVVLLDLAVAWWRRPDRSLFLWGLAAFGPVAVFLSMPAVFVAGGIGLALLVPVIRSNSAAGRWAFVAFGLGVLGSFGLLMAVSLNTPASEILRDFYLKNYWADSFPPLASGVGPVVAWLASIHAGNLFAYPIGGENGASGLTLVCAIVGVVGLWKGRMWPALIALLTPFALNLAAAAIQRYPYGGEARIAQHLAPAICLLAALGIDRLVQRIGRPGRRVAVTRILLGSILLIGAGQFSISILKPYQLESSYRARSFARWFWPTVSHDAAVACVKSQHQRDFEPWQWVTGISAEYLCNQRIYRARDPRPAVPGRNRPLRCVVYQVESYGPVWEKPAFRDWVDPLRRTYRLDRITTYPVNVELGGPDWKHEYYHVLEFVLRDRAKYGDAPDALEKLLADQMGPLVRCF